MLAFFAFFALCFAVGCGGSSSTTQPASPDPAPGDGGVAANVITFDLGATVAAATETHVCELVKMPDAPGEIFVSGGDYTTTFGTHHFLLFRTAAIDPGKRI